MEANNMAAMRESLVKIREDAASHTLGGAMDPWKIIEICKSALSLPPRNCDIGTAEEQSNRMRQFCAKRKINGIVNCGYCPIKHQYQRDCTLAWAQMPYAEEGGAK